VMNEVLASVCKPRCVRAFSKYAGNEVLGRINAFDGEISGWAGLNEFIEAFSGLPGREIGGESRGI
jgi:hypothetical protein